MSTSYFIRTWSFVEYLDDYRLKVIMSVTACIYFININKSNFKSGRLELLASIFGQRVHIILTLLEKEFSL